MKILEIKKNSRCWSINNNFNDKHKHFGSATSRNEMFVLCKQIGNSDTFNVFIIKIIIEGTTSFYCDTLKISGMLMTR